MYNSVLPRDANCFRTPSHLKAFSMLIIYVPAFIKHDNSITYLQQKIKSNFIQLQSFRAVYSDFVELI